MRYLVVVLLALLSFGAQAENVKYEVIRDGARFPDMIITYEDEEGSYRGTFIDVFVHLKISKEGNGSWKVVHTLPNLTFVSHIPQEKGPYYHNQLGTKRLILFDEESTNAGWITHSYLSNTLLGREYEEKSSVVIQLPKEEIESKETCKILVDERNRIVLQKCFSRQHTTQIIRADIRDRSLK